MCTTLNSDVIGAEDWTPSTFKAATTEGPLTVSGKVCGFFGIHRHGAARVYRITHLPSGAMLGASADEARAVRAVASVSSVCDWSFSRPEDMPVQELLTMASALLESHRVQLPKDAPDVGPLWRTTVQQAAA